MLKTLAIAIVPLIFATASAQVPPFFAGGGTAYDPQIGVINSGVVSDMTAVVSADRKYVTLGAQVSRSQAVLREFAVQQVVSQGFVGGARPGGELPQVKPGEQSPAAIERSVRLTILDRPGMARIDSHP